MRRKIALTADIVLATFITCECEADEDQSYALTIEGVTRTWRLHKKRVENCHNDIVALLAQLPDTFQRAKGGPGAPLSTAGWNKNGEEWTGMISLTERLYVLGLAIQRITTLQAGGDPTFIVT